MINNFLCHTYYLLKKIITLGLCLLLLSFVYLHTSDGKKKIKAYLEKQLSLMITFPLVIDSVDFPTYNSFQAQGIHVYLPSGSDVNIKSIVINGPFLSFFLNSHFNCTATDIQIGALPPLQMQGSGVFFEKKFVLQAQLVDNLTLIASLNANVPLTRLYGLPLPDSRAPLNADVNIALPIAPYANHFVPETLFLAGDINACVVVSGTLAEPQINGQGKLIDGYCESLSLGASFTNIESHYVIEDAALKILSFIAKDAHAGTLKGQGVLKFEQELPFACELELKQVSLLQTNLLEGIFSGSLSYTGNRHQKHLKGQLLSDTLICFLPENRTQGIDAIDVTYVNQNAIETPPTKPKQDRESSLYYDLLILNSKHIFVQGNGLTSLWKGDIAIIGNSDTPQIDAELRLASGSYLYRGKPWKLSQGTISLKGERARKSSLYVAAKSEVSAIDIEVILKGPFDDLSLAFRSSPQMTQKEILCYLLFGRGLREISSFQGAELSRSVNKLQNVSTDGFDLFGKIKDTFGFIDRVDIVSGSDDNDDDVSLKIGSYVLPKVFVGIKKNFSSNVNGLEIEANILPNVKLQAELGDDRGKQIHLKWKKDY